jgi:D-arabinose 1-dehydrogenase-like Zn-dependent alcohol dehydrogenase
MCEECQLGFTYYCTVNPNNYGGDEDNATWATHAVLPATRLAKIPDSIPAEFAGPLMCAGQTVWLPLARTDIRPWHTVGIVGIGGLGHLAIQFANKMGCEVVVFSGSDNKRDEAMKLGASKFYTAADLKEGKVPKNIVHHLLVTTSELPNWSL